MSSLFGFNAPANFSIEATAASQTESFFVPTGAGSGSGSVTSVTGIPNQITVTGAAATPLLSLAPPVPVAIPYEYVFPTISVDEFGRINDAKNGDGVANVAGTTNELAISATPNQIIALASPNPAPTAGSYTNVNLTVDGLGRTTVVSNGTGGSSGVTSVTGTATQIVIGGTPTDPVVSLGIPAGMPVSNTYNSALPTLDTFGRVQKANAGNSNSYVISTGTATMNSGTNSTPPIIIPGSFRDRLGIFFTITNGLTNASFSVPQGTVNSFTITTTDGSNTSQTISFSWITFLIL